MIEAPSITAIINSLWKVTNIPSNKNVLKPLITLRPKYGMHEK